MEEIAPNSPWALGGCCMPATPHSAFWLLCPAGDPCSDIGSREHSLPIGLAAQGQGHSDR